MTDGDAPPSTEAPEPDLPQRDEVAHDDRFDEDPSRIDTPIESVDLDAIERDLADVERALERLSDGTYWTDEVTGEAIPDHVLAEDPTARRA